MCFTSSPTTSVSTYPCGPVALACYFHCTGSNISIHAARLSLGDKKLHSMLDLQMAARMLGRPLAGRKITSFDDFCMQPSILHLNTATQGHFVVIRPLDAARQLVQIIDPINTTEVIPFRDLIRRTSWSGFALCSDRPQMKHFHIGILALFTFCVCVHYFRRMTAIGSSRSG